MYTAPHSSCTSHSYIEPLTQVYFILCLGYLHFIQLKLYIAIIGIDLISLISKIHIHLKVSIFRYTMGNRCIFFVSIDYFANSISRQSNVHYDWLNGIMLSRERCWLVRRRSHIIMVRTKYLFYLSRICLAKFHLWLFAQPHVTIQLLRKDNSYLRSSLQRSRQ